MVLLMPYPVFVNIGIEQLNIQEAEFVLYVHFNFLNAAWRAKHETCYHTTDHCLGVNII